MSKSKSRYSPTKLNKFPLWSGGVAFQEPKSLIKTTSQIFFIGFHWLDYPRRQGKIEMPSLIFCASCFSLDETWKALWTLPSVENIWR